MKTHHTQHNGLGGDRRGFTLLELLVVITVIAVLVSMVSSAAGIALRNGRVVQARAATRSVRQAISDYEAEYNRLPLSSGVGESEFELSSGAPLLSTLMGTPGDRLNPKQIPFMQPNVARSGVNGLVGDEGSWSLVDPWGEPLVVMLDANNDSRMANPDVSNSDERIATNAPSQLANRALVYSLGPDKIAGTADDVCSWR